MKNGPVKKVKTPTTKSESKRYCESEGCKSMAASKGYCRLHYITNWKLIRLNDHLKAEKRLNAYVEKLAEKYPKDWMEKIKEGVEDESKFRQTVEELDVELQADEPDTNNEFLEKFMRTVKTGDK